MLQILLGIVLSASSAQELVPTVVIDESENQSVTSPIIEFSTFKTEKVSKQKFNEPQRQTLSDLVKDQIGVDSQVYCANCGAKRLTINGLKGEHTSILVDGIPLHSAISSFYGVDTVPVNGIQEINVMRGAGASLTNPEAIGGTLNLITVDPLVKKQSYSTSLSVNDELVGTAQNHSFLVTVPNGNKTFGVSAGGQFSRSEAWDTDQNGVTESPQRENYSALLKGRILPNAANDLTLRLGISELEILGGPMRPKKPSVVRDPPAQESDFEDGRVDRKFIGDPFRITDWVSLKRYESAAQWVHYLSPTSTIKWNNAFARQEQQAIYQHGFDYANNDNMFVSDLSLETLHSNNHIFKVGLFHKDQRLRSASEALFEQPDPEDNIKRDHFDHQSYAAYIQDTFIFSETLELDFATRLDHIQVNWLELTNRIDQTVLAPRFQLRNDINDHLSQRFSYGLGYRAPLTFFESQHGNQERGYEIDIQKLEKAHSAVYSISQNTPDYYVTAGVHYTYLENMAYGLEREGQSTLYLNSDEAYHLWTTDLLTGYRVLPWWFIEGSIEFFKYQDGYTKKLPTAAIEQRFQLKSAIEKGPWNHQFSAIFIGSRDLSRYGRYDQHYVDRDQSSFPEPLGSELKPQKAPAFVTFDTSLSYQVKKELSATLGVTNIFNYTQAGQGDNPSAWHRHFTHSHFDGLHTWGPNRGREVYFQLSAEI